MIKFERYPFIVSPEVKRLHETIDLLRGMHYTKDGDMNLLLTGESGLGKSEVLQRYELRNPRVDEEDRTRVPVLYVNVRSPKTMKALLKEILVRLGDPQRGQSGDTNDLLGRLSWLCQVCGVEVIILDEAQTLMQNRSAGYLATIADWIRDLSDGVCVPLVLAGMPWCEGYVESYEQIATRFGYRHHLKDYTVSKGFDRYVNFVAKYVTALDERSSIDASDLDFILRLFSCTAGKLRATTGILNLACSISLGGRSGLSRRHVQEAAEIKYGANDSFSASIKKITLKEVVSPSQWVNQKGYNRERHVSPVYDVYKVKDNFKLVKQ